MRDRDYLQALYDGDTFIFASAFCAVLDVKKTQDDAYMILTDTGVYYVYVYGDKRITVSYPKTCHTMFLYQGTDIDMSSSQGKKYDASGRLSIDCSAKIISDNVFRMEYPDGCITHWRVKQTKEDIKKNMQKLINDKSIMSGLNVLADASIIWANTLDSKYVAKLTCEAWSCKVGSEEPVYAE